MNSKAVIKALEAAGWYRVSEKGSHIKFRHAVQPGNVIVPHPKNDIPIGTLRSIEK